MDWTYLIIDLLPRFLAPPTCHGVKIKLRVTAQGHISGCQWNKWKKIAYRCVQEVHVMVVDQDDGEKDSGPCLRQPLKQTIREAAVEDGIYLALVTCGHNSMILFNKGLVRIISWKSWSSPPTIPTIPNQTCIRSKRWVSWTFGPPPSQFFASKYRGFQPYFVKCFRFLQFLPRVLPHNFRFPYVTRCCEPDFLRSGISTLFVPTPTVIVNFRLQSISMAPWLIR